MRLAGCRCRRGSGGERSWAIQWMRSPPQPLSRLWPSDADLRRMRCSLRRWARSRPWWRTSGLELLPRPTHEGVLETRREWSTVNARSRVCALRGSCCSRAGLIAMESRSCAAPPRLALHTHAAAAKSSWRFDSWLARGEPHILWKLPTRRV